MCNVNEWECEVEQATPAEEVEQVTEQPQEGSTEQNQSAEQMLEKVTEMRLQAENADLKMKLADLQKDLEEAEQDRDAAYADRNSAVEYARKLEAEARTLRSRVSIRDTEIRRLTSTKAKSIAVPGVRMVVFVAIAGLCALGVEHELLSPLAGEPIACISMMCCTFCSGLIWERTAPLLSKQNRWRK